MFQSIEKNIPVDCLEILLIIIKYYFTLRYNPNNLLNFKGLLLKIIFKMVKLQIKILLLS